MADSELRVNIVAHDEATRTLQNIQREVTSLHGSMNQMGVVAGAVGGIVATGLTSALGALNGALSGAGQSTIGMSSKLEQAGIAFETMLGSAQKAQVFLADLQDFAAKTPFEFPELVDASKKMLAFGFTAEQVRPVLTAVGNAAAAMGSGAEGIDRITRALGQMQAKGLVQAEEILQLTEAGIPAWDMLAKKLGTDVAGAMDAVTKRTVTAATFLEAFQTGTAARFGDMMERQSHTFAGAMSTIKDTIGQLIGGAFQPFFVQISQFADNLAQAFTGDAFGVWAANVQEVLSRLAPLFGQFMTALTGLGPVIQQFVNDHIQGFVAGVQSLGEQVLAVLPTIGEMFGHLGERIERGLGIVGPIIEKVAGALGSLAAPAGDLIQSVERLSDTFQSRLGDALNSLAGPAQELRETLDTLQPLFETIGTVATQALGDVQTAIQQVRDIFGPLSTDVGDLSTAVGGMVDQVVPAIQAFADAAHEAFLGFMETAINAWNAVSPTLQDLRTWLGETIPPVLATLQDSWNNFWGHAGPLLDAFWGAAQPILGQIAAILGSTLVLALTELQKLWNTVWGGITAAMERIRPIVGALASAFGGMWAELADKMTVALNALRDKPAEAAEESVAQVGHAFIEGTPPVVAAAAALGEQAGEAVGQIATGVARVPPALATLPPAAAAAGAGVAAGLAPAKEAHEKVVTAAQAHKAALDALLQSIDPLEVSQGKLIQAYESFATATLPKLALAQQAHVQALLNEGRAAEAAAAAGSAYGRSLDDVTAIIQGNHQAQVKWTAALKGETIPVLNSVATAMYQMPDNFLKARDAAVSWGLGIGQTNTVMERAAQIHAQWKKALEEDRAAGRDTANSLGQLRDAFAQAAQEIANAAIKAENAGRNWRQVGGYIVDGIRSGIGDFTSRELFERVNGMLEQGRNQVREALQAHSPSQLWADTVGKTIPEGIAKGVEAGMPSALAAISGSLDQLTDRATAFGDNISRALTGSMGQMARQAAQEMVNVREGGWPTASFGIGSVESMKNASAFQAAQKEWAQAAFGTSDLSAIWDPRTGGLLTAAKGSSGGSSSGVAGLSAYGGLLGGLGYTTQQLQEALAFANPATIRQYQGTFGSTGSLNASGTFQSGSGFAQSPAAFYFGQGELIASGARFTDLAQSAQQTNVAMQALAQALRTNVATIASIPQAFSAYALTPPPGLGTGITTAAGGNATGVPSGNTAGGVAYAMLQQLSSRIIGADGIPPGDFQKQLTQLMRTDKEYIQQTGGVTETLGDLDRQVDDAVREVMNWKGIVDAQSASGAMFNGTQDRLNAAMQDLADVTARRVALLESMPVPGVTTPNPTQVVAPFVGLTGGMLGLFGPEQGMSAVRPTIAPTTVQPVTAATTTTTTTATTAATAGTVKLGTSQGMDVYRMPNGTIVRVPAGSPPPGTPAPTAPAPTSAIEGLNAINASLGITTPLTAPPTNALAALNAINATLGITTPYPTPTPTLTVPPSGTGGTGGGSIVFSGDINVQGSSVSTAQDAAAFWRQVREEARRQGVDLSRVGGF